MIDGNKRIGAHVMLIFLELNGVEIEYTQKELYTTVLAVADGSLDCDELLKWILKHQV